jgi:hypothetical protein
MVIDKNCKRHRSDEHASLRESRALRALRVLILDYGANDIHKLANCQILSQSQAL